ncbi:MAG: HEAT repeat domain-containing protein [Chloroflexaceae bacterium]
MLEGAISATGAAVVVKESLHILIGGADLDQFARVLSNVFTHGLQEMHKRGQFGGDVMIVIIPDLTPRSRELDELLPRVQAHLQGVGRELHERGAFTSPVSVTFHYGMPGENPPLAGPPSASSGIRRIKPAAQPAEPAIAVETLDTTELINALGSDDAGVREAAATRLAEQGRQDQQVVRRLIVALGSNNSQVSLGAVQALALIGEPVVPLPPGSAACSVRYPDYAGSGVWVPGAGVMQSTLSFTVFRRPYA